MTDVDQKDRMGRQEKWAKENNIRRNQYWEEHDQFVTLLLFCYCLSNQTHIHPRFSTSTSSGLDYLRYESTASCNHLTRCPHPTSRQDEEGNQSRSQETVRSQTALGLDEQESQSRCEDRDGGRMVERRAALPFPLDPCASQHHEEESHGPYGRQGRPPHTRSDLQSRQQHAYPVLHVEEQGLERTAGMEVGTLVVEVEGEEELRREEEEEVEEAGQLDVRMERRTPSHPSVVGRTLKRRVQRKTCPVPRILLHQRKKRKEEVEAGEELMRRTEWQRWWRSPHRIDPARLSHAWNLAA